MVVWQSSQPSFKTYVMPLLHCTYFYRSSHCLQNHFYRCIVHTDIQHPYGICHKRYLQKKTMQIVKNNPVKNHRNGGYRMFAPIACQLKNDVAFDKHNKIEIWSKLFVFYNISPYVHSFRLGNHLYKHKGIH